MEILDLTRKALENAFAQNIVYIYGVFHKEVVAAHGSSDKVGAAKVRFMDALDRAKSIYRDAITAAEL